MISTSNAWKTHANDSNVFDIRATMTGGSTVNLTSEDFMLGSVSFTDSISSMSEIKFGSVVTNTFNATLVNTNGRFDNWTWNRISVEFGYNGEWIGRGVYNIDRPETIGNTVKIECYDDMDRLNQYFKGFITQTFPVTYKALIQAICTACGVTFGTWGSGIPNTNVTALVASAFNESTTCRQVVSWILEVCGAYARINPVTNKLDCKVWNGTGSYALVGVKEQNIYIDDVTVTGVRAYTYNTNDEYDYATAGTDGYVVYIKDNPFVSATNKQTLAEQALTNGGGGSVRPFNATIFGDPSMEAGDIITLTDRRDNTYTSIITSINYTLCGSMRVSCEAKTPQDNSLDYSNPYDSAVWASISYTDNAVEELSSDLQSQIDAKIETWYQTTDPSTAWTTTALKNAHIGDIWHNSSTNKSYRWGGTAWQEIDGVPQSLLDTVDGKTTIHYGTTSSVTTAEDGDYLVDKTSGITYRWQNNAWVEQIALPVVNLLPSVYRREYQQGSNTYTNTGITWTVNDDGSVTANGTATAVSYFTLTAGTDTDYPPRAKLDPTKRYRLHGCPSGGGSSKYVLRGQRLVNGSVANQDDTGSGVTITANATAVYVLCVIQSGYTANNLTFYPMLEEGTVDHAYVSPKTVNANYENVQVSLLQSTLETQIDAKIETWVRGDTNAPSVNWTTDALKAQHAGDLWFYNGTTPLTLTASGITIQPSLTYQYYLDTSVTPNVYKWKLYNAPSESLYDFADGKSTIYYGTTSSVTSADDGDYLVDKTNGITYQWTNNAWVQQIASPVVNLMPSLYQSEAQFGSTRTASGVTWTLNKDGSLTANGTATANTSFIIAERNLTGYTVPCITVDPNQRYIIHGCPANGTSKYRIVARCTPSGVTPTAETGSVVYDYGDGVLIPAGTKYIYTFCQVISGNTVSNITFYPMLEVGTVKHGFVSNRTNMASYTTSQIDGIKVGGRNLLNNTASMATVGDRGKIFRASGGAVSNVSLSNPPINGLSRAIRVTNSGSSALNIGIAQDGLSGFVTGRQYTESCWVRASQSLQVYLQPLWLSSSQNAGNNGNAPFTIGTDWTYIKWTGTLVGTQAEQYSAGYVYAKSVPQNGWIEVCGLKLEEGNKATDWTPSPEDVESMATTNLLPSIYYSEYDSTSSTYSHNGITYTIGKDGSITANGTPSGTSNSWFSISGNTLTSQIPVVTLDPNNTYILHGCPSGGSSTTYKIQARCHKSNETPNGSGGTLVEDVGDGVLLPVGTKYAYIYTYIYNAAGQVTNLKFYPMLETGSVKHPYVSSRSNATSYAESKVTALDNSFNQTKVFNRLTNNGALQGLYMDGGDMYVNATYIKTGSLQAERIGNGTIGSAITASNLTMTGGSISLNTSNVGNDVINLSCDDWETTMMPGGCATNNSTYHITAGTWYNPSGVEVSARRTSGSTTSYLFRANIGNSTSGDSITMFNEPVVDTVIEEGTWNTSGWYRKWHSGKAECHAYFSFTTAVSTSYGSGKAYYVSKSISFPNNLFVAGPVTNLTIERNGGLLYPSISASSKTKVDFHIASPVSEASATIWVHITAFGKWKS